jgi:hypothetical protein
LAFLLPGVVLLGLIFKNWRPKARALLSFGLLLWMGLDICTHEPPQNPAVSARAYAAEPPPMTPAPQVGQSRAMLGADAESIMDHLVNPDLLRLYLGQRAELFSDCNLLNGIPKVGGFMSLHLVKEHAIELMARGGKAAPGVAQFLGVSQIASPTTLFDWLPQTNFMPWATIGQKPVFLEDDATLAALCAADFEPRQTVYLPSGARSQTTAGADGQARILSSRIEPSECVFQTSAQSRTMLVMAQAFYPCWRASVDGAPVPLLRANYAFQALEVPPGRHEVRLAYVDRAFQTGAVVSILALAVCLTALWKSKGNTAAGAMLVQ